MQVPRLAVVGRQLRERPALDEQLVDELRGLGVVTGLEDRPEAGAQGADLAELLRGEAPDPADGVALSLFTSSTATSIPQSV